ncbi:interleukin-10 receptor subunit alpha [Ambystoma mexicanum]|uniref:interleukin-10 receptor subunit alpha n=1 Tax=Ambystoma mexicanum TaxID=8296 RepID=UPI0037E7E862
MALRLPSALQVLALSTAFCLSGARGEGLPSPRNVHFSLDFFHHVLEWEPGHSQSTGDLYEVEYKKYATRSTPWTHAANCKGIANHWCDLTMETLPLTQGWYGRVRAVSGNQTSNWTRTTRFSLQQVVLPAPDMSLKVERNTIRVVLHTPSLQGKNITRTYEDIFKQNRVYQVHIRRTSDNLTFTQNEESEHFDVSSLAWGEQYCITVRPAITSRPNPGNSTEEACVSLQAEERIGVIVLATFSCITVLCMLLVFGNIFVCLYIKRPMKTPETLKLPIKASSFWMEQWQPPPWINDVVVCLDEECMKRLSMDQKNSTVRLSTDSGFGSDKISLESESRSLTPTFDDPAHSPVMPQCSENSWTGTDSGICTRGTIFSSSQLTCMGSQGYRKQLDVMSESMRIQEDSGISVQHHSQDLSHCAKRNKSLLDIVNSGQDKVQNSVVCPNGVSCGINMEGIDLNVGHAACNGYLQQSKGMDGTRQNGTNCEPMNGQCVSVLSGTLQRDCTVDVEPELGSSPPCGYLKQESKQQGGSNHSTETLVHADIYLTGERNQNNLLITTASKESGFLHNPLDFPFDHIDCNSDLWPGQHILGKLITDIGVFSPLAPHTETQKGFHLEFSTLTLADVEFKDRF